MFLWLHTHLNTLQVLHTFNTQENRCAQWFFLDLLSKGTRRITNPMICCQIAEIHDLVNPCPEWIPLVHWSGNGFAWKERDRSVILIQILPMECTLSLYTDVLFLFSFFSKHQRARKKNKNICRHLWEKRGLLSPSPMSTPYHYHLHVTN